MNMTLLIMCITLSTITVLFPLVAIIVGAVKRRVALRPVSYYPPRGYSPIDVLIRYYGFRANTHALINPMMLYWASRGFITIEEDGKRGLKLTKLRDLVQDDKPLDKPDTSKRKRKTAQAPARNPQPVYSEQSFREEWTKELNFEAEKKLFDSIFNAGDVFYTLAAHASHLDDNKEFMKKCKDTAVSTKSELSKKLSIISFILALASTVIATIACATATGGGPIYMTMLFAIIAIIGLRFIPNMIQSEGNTNVTMMYIMYPFFAVWGGVPFCTLLALTPVYASVPLAVTVFTSTVTIIFLSSKIDIRTARENELFGQIQAFKTFLLDAEADRINTLVEENPYYYYDVLPYCYILKITKKLKAKFDHVALDGPSWYLGDLRNTLMF